VDCEAGIRLEKLIAREPVAAAVAAVGGTAMDEGVCSTLVNIGFSKVDVNIASTRNGFDEPSSCAAAVEGDAAPGASAAVMTTAGGAGDVAMRSGCDDGMAAYIVDEPCGVE
jgi:hypothetical protein